MAKKVIKGHGQKTYWILKSSDESIIHYGSVDVGNVVESGLTDIETFTNLGQWTVRLSDFGINPNPSTEPNLDDDDEI